MIRTCYLNFKREVTQFKVTQNIGVTIIYIRGPVGSQFLLAVNSIQIWLLSYKSLKSKGKRKPAPVKGILHHLKTCVTFCYSVCLPDDDITRSMLTMRSYCSLTTPFFPFTFLTRTEETPGLAARLLPLVCFKEF